MASEDFTARLKSLITRFGFRPDEVNVSNRFGVGTISFRNQKGKATELVSKLRGAMKQSGVPESAITAREVQYPADEDGPAEHWGVVNVDFNKMPHSRPGAPDTFAVEDRFYFGKGRKERFAEPREIEAKIRAWIDSRGLPIGSQETNALSYVAAQHMIRGGASIEQAVKSAARRHAQIGLASAGLRTWLEENA